MEKEIFYYNKLPYSNACFALILFAVAKNLYEIGGSTATEVSKDVYSYDTKGNITQIVNKTGNTVNNTVSYVYDGLNRLSRENNSALNKTWTYAYDVGGNITVKTEYAYTTGTLGTPTNTISYGYDTTWKDKLTSWNGLSGTANFNYDNVGNPTKYKGNTLTWTRGRMLSEYNGYEMSYNANGIRYYKHKEVSLPLLGRVTHYNTDYILNGTSIVKEKRTKIVNVTSGDPPVVTTTTTVNTLKYIYANDGIAGFTYDGTPYYYRKNSFGDIVEIYNSSNTLVGSYTYDAWGNCTIGTNVGSIASVNPYRYRGYYWDSDLSLYYLQSRYYDPAVGRFINADDLDYLKPKDILGCNIYAYCKNNPVMNVDPMGNDAVVFLDRSFGNGIGHVGIYVQDPSNPGIWYMFEYVPGIKWPFGYFDAYVKKTTYYNSAWENEDEYLYVKGDFSAGLDWLNSVENEGNYYLLFNSCLDLVRNALLVEGNRIESLGVLQYLLNSTTNIPSKFFDNLWNSMSAMRSLYLALQKYAQNNGIGITIHQANDRRRLWHDHVNIGIAE
ncbi:MAG: RHS repeat-associated core domain-containing protein [Clostridia bacterium]|nr:RHS repeat-associated core domain-containing protein [Clostridia bacterium]